MSMHQRNKSADEKYRKNQLDNAPIVDLNKSIREMRVIYSNLTDLEFAALYSHRYKVRIGQVMKVIAEMKQDGGDQDRNVDSSKR